MNSRITLLAASLTCALIALIGCRKPSDQLDQNWTPAATVASSIEGLMGWLDLHVFRDTFIGVNVLRDGAGELFTLDTAKNVWVQLPVSRISSGNSWGFVWGFAAIDSRTGRILLPNGYMENEQLVMKALMGTITSAGVRDITENTWITEKEALIGETGPNVRLNDPGRRRGAGLAAGILSDSEVLIPFSVYAETAFGLNNVSNGPFACGIFHSTDFGKTWQMEKIAGFKSLAPEVCKTDGYYYYFGIGTPILRQGVWASRRPISGRPWDAASMIAETFAYVSGRYAVAGDGDTVHLCWMDRRHNKRRFNYGGPPIENNDIYYRHRKDSEREWSKELHLSKGLLYCYAPRISVEGKNVVVVWAGIQTADKHHTDMGPNDIYYVTSKDGGNTWTSPLRVTDGAKDGITAGMPQVALLNGTIHLLYTQGKGVKATELSPGLTKLGGESWPIYYTHRPFPN